MNRYTHSQALSQARPASGAAPGTLLLAAHSFFQVDFIGYIPNPHYSRSKAPGAARKAALHLQHSRLKLAEEKANVEAARAARVQVGWLNVKESIGF